MIFLEINVVEPKRQCQWYFCFISFHWHKICIECATSSDVL